jgi:hypothetical protein
VAHELAHVARQSETGPNAAQRQADGDSPATTAATPVFICWSPTEAAPFANHSWFRTSGTEAKPDHETFSLFPRLVKQAPDGTWCAQGKTFRGSADEDLNRAGTCALVQISAECVARQFSSYPIGLHCPPAPTAIHLPARLRASVVRLSSPPTSCRVGTTIRPPPALSGRIGRRCRSWMCLFVDPRRANRRLQFNRLRRIRLYPALCRLPPHQRRHRPPQCIPLSRATT